MSFFGECWRSITQVLWSNIFLDSFLTLIRDVAANIGYRCKLILVDAFKFLLVALVRELFMKALVALIRDIGELVGIDPLGIISDTILDTLWKIGLGLVSILRRLIRIVIAALILAVLCCLDVTVGSLRISMCIMNLCLDMIEVLLRRVLNVSPYVYSYLHVGFLSLLILLVS